MAKRRPIKRTTSKFRRPPSKAGVELRYYTNPGGWLTPASQAGPTVTPQSALNLGAYYCAVQVISTDTAMLPTVVYKRSGRGGKAPDPRHPAYDLLTVEPNVEMSAFAFKRSLIGHALGWGNGYAHILRNVDGSPYALVLLDPQLVRPERTRDGRLLYKIQAGVGSESRPSDRTILPENMIHLAGFGFDGILGYSVATHARQTIGAGLAQELYRSSFYGNGAHAGGFLKTPKNLHKEARETLREEFSTEHGGSTRAHRVGVLVGDLEWVQTTCNPEDSAVIASSEFTVVDIARWFNISPLKLHDLSRGTYSNYEQASLDYVTTTLMPWVVALESELNRKLLTREDRLTWEIKHDVSARLRGDEAARVAYYQGLFPLAGITPNEIREAEGFNIYSGLDSANVPYLATNNYAPLGQDPLPESGGQTLPNSGPLVDPVDAPSPAGDESPTPDRSTPGEAVRAVRAVVLDAIDRSVSRETLALRRAVKKVDRPKAVGDFYEGHAPIVREILTPAIAAYSAVSGRSFDLDAILAALTVQSRDEVLLHTDYESGERLISRWEAEKAEDILARLERKS